MQHTAASGVEDEAPSNDSCVKSADGRGDQSGQQRRPLVGLFCEAGGASMNVSSFMRWLPAVPAHDCISCGQPSNVLLNICSSSCLNFLQVGINVSSFTRLGTGVR